MDGKKRLFSVAGVATKEITPGSLHLALVSMPIIVFSKEEAEIIGMDTLKRDYPPSQNWRHHEVAVAEVPAKLYILQGEAARGPSLKRPN